MALFVFIFMAASTLHSSFLKFLLLLVSLFFFNYTLSLLLFVCTNFSIFEILGFWHCLLIVHGGQKIESAQTFMQVEVDHVKCMQTNFGECGSSGFGDLATIHLSSKRPKFPFGQ